MDSADLLSSVAHINQLNHQIGQFLVNSRLKDSKVFIIKDDIMFQNITGCFSFLFRKPL